MKQYYIDFKLWLEKGLFSEDWRGTSIGISNWEKCWVIALLIVIIVVAILKLCGVNI